MRFRKLNALHIHIPKTGGTTIAFELLRQLEPQKVRMHGGKFIMQMLRDIEYAGVTRKSRKAHVPAKDFRKVFGFEEYSGYWKFAIIRNPFDQIRSLFYQLKVMDLKINPRFEPYKKMRFEEFIMGNGEFSIEENGDMIDQKAYVTDIEGRVIVDKVYLFDDYEEAVDDISENVGLPISLLKKWRKTDKTELTYTPEMVDRVMELYGHVYEFYSKVKKENVLS